VDLQGLIVASPVLLALVVPGDAGMESVLCLVAGHNRVDLARLAAITSAPDISAGIAGLPSPSNKPW
jgi:hypothetical protein